MSEISTADGAEQYEIRVKGHLESRWAAWFDGLTLTTCSDGTTVIHGIVLDQSALHGLIQKVGDVGLPLISVTRVESAISNHPTVATTDRPIRVRQTQAHPSKEK